MPQTLGRRTVFFAVTCLVSILLVPAAPAEFRWVAWFSAALGGFWAVATALEDLTGPGGPKDRAPRVRRTGPFEPPPAPGARD
jgi:hypothetical protein